MVIWKKSFGYSVNVYFSNQNIRQLLIKLRARNLKKTKGTNVKLKMAEGTGTFNVKRKRNLD